MEKEMDNNRKKYRIVISFLCAIVGLLIVLLTIITTLLVNNEPIKYSEYINIHYFSDEDLSDYDDYSYGLIVRLNVDFEKHPKYNEWLESNDLQDGYDLMEKIDVGYYEKMYNSFYETIKVDFINIDCKISKYSPTIDFHYSVVYRENETIKKSKEKLDEIEKKFFKSYYYKKLVELSNEKYMANTSIYVGFLSNQYKDE